MTVVLAKHGPSRAVFQQMFPERQASMAMLVSAISARYYSKSSVKDHLGGRGLAMLGLFQEGSQRGHPVMTRLLWQ